MPGKYKAEELRKLIVEAKRRGEHHTNIAERYHVGQATVFRIWNLWKETRSVKPRKKTGRPKKTTPRQVRLLVRQVKKYPFMTAVQMAQYGRDHLNVNISSCDQVEGLSNQILSVFSCYYVVSGVYLLFLFCERIKIAINM